jgi:hypothetical protein
MKPLIEDRIKSAFNGYRDTIDILEEFVKSKKNPIELVILACSRLDALANLAYTQKRSQRDRFVSFLSTYSSKNRELNQVSLPNLYGQLMVQFVTLPETLPKPGRMHAYDILREGTFLQFMIESDLPIEEEEMTKFLHQLSVWIQRKYRTTLTQSRKKPYLDTDNNVINHLRVCSKTYRKGLYNKAIDALKPILHEYRLSDLLYRDYRSGSIHDFDFEVDDEFFLKTDIYTSTRWYTGDKTEYLELCFPARWIINLYKSSIVNYEKYLIVRKKLPLSLWKLICEGIKELEFLDDDSVQVGRDLNIRIDH